MYASPFTPATERDQRTSTEHKSRVAGLLYRQSKGHRFTYPWQPRTTIVEVPVKQEHFLCQHGFFPGIRRCHLDLQPICFCLCISYIPFILQACHNLLTVSSILSQAWKLLQGYSEFKNIYNERVLVRRDVFRVFFHSFLDFVSVGVRWLTLSKV